jgi:hypothetical protein
MRANSKSGIRENRGLNPFHRFLLIPFLRFLFVTWFEIPMAEITAEGCFLLRLAGKDFGCTIGL